MKTMLKISNGIDALLISLGKTASFALLGLIVVVVFDVVTRRLFQMGSTQLQEAEWHLHTILIMCFLGATYIYDQHVRIDLVSGTFSPKRRALVELLGILLLLLPFCAVTGYYATNFAYTSFVRNEVSQSIDGLPYRWAIKSMLPLGIYLLALAGISRALRAIVAMSSPKIADLDAKEREQM
ncbi:TRAP transporter small permease subunit [Halomonas sp. HAL1]|uniref:TRAP transporter small permease subunit n=1 Tax=Halomonas sp. HAL1 TaxID=550984 RepID=UPI00022D2C13|nr:TRAP transporter small permease subunit [Halomonas sp. HAL1]EHA17533.1 TRAP-type mannitol/chloroaromatic compound transporter small permease [Halomonas sp. HAL1]WKV92675.1 TRAP transporter small permease subunit [Halomonas sp. HAL1]